MDSSLAMLGAIIATLVIIVWLVIRSQEGLSGGAAIVSGIAAFGCRRLFLGIIVLVVIAIFLGFVAGRFV